MRSMMSDWNVELIDDSVSEFEVIFKGPKESKSAPYCPVFQSLPTALQQHWYSSINIGEDKKENTVHFPFLITAKPSLIFRNHVK